MKTLCAEVRAAFRLTRVGLHLVWGVAMVALVYPWIDLRLKRWLKQCWSRQLLEILGVRLSVNRETSLPGGLLVSNHISWLDIFVINALAPAAFVAKDDVKRWPLIGWLCAHTETIFLKRGSRAAAQRTREEISDRLRAGGPVAVFPEGTTSRGGRVLPFHAALFQSAIDAAAPVVPLMLRYVDRRGHPSRAPAYDGEITLWQSLWAIARTSGLTAELCVLPPIAAQTATRRALAERCHDAIARCLEQRNGMPLAAAGAAEQSAEERQTHCHSPFTSVA